MLQDDTIIQKHMGKDIELTARALRHEGRVDHDTYEWFDKEYRKKFRLEEQKKRHQQNSIHSLGA
jgi:hypothetical protein